MNRLLLVLTGCILMFSVTQPLTVTGQDMGVIVDLSPIDGIELSPKNIYNYRIINNTSELKEVTVSATLRYRQSRLWANYSFETKLYPGNNQFSEATVLNPSWQFSDNALKELFFTYGKLPQGTYEYCISIQLKKVLSENPSPSPVNDCIYQTVNDIFLINLLEPEDDAKIYEYHPMLSWVVNYPFASALTYRVRVAELKKGQNNISAITRNNPIYQESNVSPTSIIYPVTARPLQAYQPYVWTVDAYYKGILLGGAETWRFTIIEDSLLTPKHLPDSYYDFVNHIGETRIPAPGTIRLKYISDKSTDTLLVKIYDKKGKESEMRQSKISLHNGANHIDIPLYEQVALKHNREYWIELLVDAKTYRIPFLYQNPLYIK